MSVLANAVSRLDDWMNPIAVKELRQAVRGKFVMVALILSLAAQLIAVAVITVSTSLGSGPGMPGPVSFTVIFSVIFTAALFFIPMYSGFRMAAERADANVDLLFITTIRPRTIVVGKVISVMGLVALLFSASLPFLLFSYVLRGMSFITIAILVVAAMFIVVSHSITALFIGCLPASRPFKILLALGFFLGTLMVLVPSLALTSEFLRAGAAGFMMFGGVRASGSYTVIAVILAIDAILLVLMTVIITPAAANRALPIRLMLFVLWAVSFGAAAWASLGTLTREALQVWAVLQMAFVTLVLLSATSERESWGPRVARTIPQNRLRRALAFLFYSGGAGGTLWAVAMYALTIAAYFAFTRFWGPRRAAAPAQDLVDAALAMVGYAMSGVLLRRTVLRRVPASRTWGLVLALFILLTLIPPLAILAGDAERQEWETYVHVTTLFNPFPTAQRPPDLQNMRTVILAIWAATTMAANAGWFLAQMGRFTLPRREPSLSILHEAAE